MKIFVELFGEDFSTNAQEPGRSKWSRLIKFLHNNYSSLEVVTDLDEMVNVYLVIDARKSIEFYREYRLQHPKCQMVLIMVEMPAVNPLQHKKELRKQFDYIFVPNPKLAKEYLGIYFNFPFLLHNHQNISFLDPSRKVTFGYVGTCKNSLVKSSLYYLRPRVLGMISKSSLLLLAGKDWDISSLARVKNDFNTARFLLENRLKPSLTKLMFWFNVSISPNYKGEVSDKFEFLSKCDVVLCMENDKYEFSEKFIDAVTLGKVPFYFGSSLDQYEIPQSIYFYGGVGLRKGRKTLRSINPTSINEKLICLSRWRESGIEKWREDVAFDDLSKQLRVVFSKILEK